MVDVARVTALLQRIRDEVAALRRIGDRPDEELLGDPDAIPAANYRLIVAIEAATDVSEHVIAAEGLRPSISFADSFQSLCEGGWVDDDLARSLGDAALFRNVLVHQYARVDERRVIEIVRSRLDDLDRFVEVMAGRLQ